MKKSNTDSLSFKKWLAEMAGTGAIVSSCKPTADYQVWGACTNTRKKKSTKKKSEY